MRRISFFVNLHRQAISHSVDASIGEWSLSALNFADAIQSP
jgi:hypothetical protein